MTRLNTTQLQEREGKQDDIPQRYFVHSREDNEYFTCVPNKTSNLDVFCFCNPDISRYKAREIFEFYKEKFIKAKLMGKELSSFMNKVHDFVSEKYNYNYSAKNFNEWDIISSYSKIYPNVSRTDEIKDLISIACYLELMYRVDRTMETINDGMTPWKQEKIATRILGTVPYNNYRSYFSKSESMPFDSKDYETRKITIKSHMNYAYKNSYHFICESEVGCVRLDVHRNHSPFLEKFVNQAREGIEINVVTSELKISIDEETSHIQIKKFFLE